MLGGRYEVIMGSDSARVGMFLELWERRPQGELVAEVFFSDVDSSFTTTRYKADIPDEVEAWLLSEAKRRLPPIVESSDANQSSR